MQVNDNGVLLEKWQVYNDKCDNNKDKVYMFLKKLSLWVRY